VSANGGGPTALVSARVMPQLTLVPVGPTSATAQVNSQVAISVRVQDVLGAGYSGATVMWGTDAGSGSILSGVETVSGSGGYVAAVWLLGPGAGPQSATASIQSVGAVIEVDFSATATAGPAVSAFLAADSVLLSARGETAYLSPTYRDAFLNPTSPSGVTWTSREPSVVTVATDGLVTGQAAGATYVVASMPSSLDSILVTVVMRGAITLTFDDGFLTAYTNAWPVFQEFGLPGNIGVNAAQVGFPAYMTKANLDELHAAGWSMVSHSMTHDSLTTASTGELDFELRASQAWIDAQGYHGSNVFIVPYHDWAVRERNAIGTYYEAARGTSAGAAMSEILVPWRPPNPYDLTGIDAESLPYTTVQGRDRLRALLERTLAEGVFLDVYLHHLPAGNVQAFRDMLTVVADFRERVLPYHELYPRFARAVQ
jgi:peptidoglycan/xylan/chitin deacetylase (PgdA/CDA1 family)